MAFAITTLLSYNVWGWSTHPAKKQVAICVWAVNVVSFFNYATKLAGVQSAVRTASGGAMRPLRYLEWSFTTSFLIRVVGVLTPDGPRARALVARTVLLDVVLIALGAAEQAAPRAYSLPLFGAALCVFLPVMGGQMRLYRLGAETLSTASDAEGLDSLRRTTLLTWCLFPVARLACLLGLVGPNAQEALFTVLDVASKFGFAVFLLVGTFSLLSPVKG
jgi:bacteriorhodopsin